MPPNLLALIEDLAAERRVRTHYDAAQRQQYELGMVHNYATCFESSAGKAVLGDLVQRYLLRPPEALELAHWHEGQRSVVLAILEVIEAGRQPPPEEG